MRRSRPWRLSPSRWVDGGVTANEAVEDINKRPFENMEVETKLAIQSTCVSLVREKWFAVEGGRASLSEKARRLRDRAGLTPHHSSLLSKMTVQYLSDSSKYISTLVLKGEIESSPLTISDPALPSNQDGRVGCNCFERGVCWSNMPAELSISRDQVETCLVVVPCSLNSRSRCRSLVT